MNTDPTVTRVLCFGDSNTWGRSGVSGDRYASDQRWTGLLQQQLGAGFEILEEGLRSRTTNLDDDDPQFPGRNGADYLRPCLESQYPLDVVVLWLGTNDLKAKYQRSAQQVVAAVEELVEMILAVGRTAQDTAPKIVLVSPPLVSEEVLKPDSQFVGAGEKSAQLAPLIEAVAQKHDCAFVDLAPLVTAGEADGVHLELEMQQVVAVELMSQLTLLIK